jgi:2-polyprenyl-6-methoxyphenol hydroxylase-like FAD-dependent oxidoreductase
MNAASGTNSEPQSQCDVAIIGAGPIGLMLANLLAAADIDVAVIERNDGLVGLPRAIAYDVETLRLFAQVGLFDAIAPGLIQNPQVVYFNARGVKLMEIVPPPTPFGHSPLGTFYQPHFEQVLLEGLKRFASASVFFAHTVTSLAQDRNGVDVQIETPRGLRGSGQPARRLARLCCAVQCGGLSAQLRTGAPQWRTTAGRWGDRRQCRLVLLRSGLQQCRILRRDEHDRELSRPLRRHERFGAGVMHSNFHHCKEVYQ